MYRIKLFQKQKYGEGDGYKINIFAQNSSCSANWANDEAMAGIRFNF